MTLVLLSGGSRSGRIAIVAVAATVADVATLAGVALFITPFPVTRTMPRYSFFHSCRSFSMSRFCVFLS